MSPVNLRTGTERPRARSDGDTIAPNSPSNELIFGARLGKRPGGNPATPPSVPNPPLLTEEEKAAKKVEKAATEYYNNYLDSKREFDNRQKETNKKEILKRFETSLQEKQVSGLWEEMTNIEGVEPTKGAFLGIPNAPKDMRGLNRFSYYAVRCLILLLAIICIVVCVAFLFTSTSDQVQWSAAFVLMTVIVVLVTMIITHWMNKKFAEQMVERYKDFQKAVYDDLKICEEQMEKRSRA